MSESQDQLPQKEDLKAQFPSRVPAPVADMETAQFPAAAPLEAEVAPVAGDLGVLQAVPEAYAWSVYQLSLLQIPKRTGLNDNHIQVIKAVGDWKSGVIDSQTMGGMLRLSPRLMEAALEISKNLDPGVVGNDSFTAKRLLQVKFDCYEAVTIAGKPPRVLFPQRQPRVTRRRKRMCVDRTLQQPGHPRPSP